MAKDRTPDTGRTNPAAGDRRPATGSRTGGRTRPAANVVAAPKRPWGLIAAALAVVVFAAAVITYAVTQVNQAEADKIDALDQISGVQAFDYEPGQEHVITPVQYEQSPPVGGAHDGEWAACTGTVYDVDIRHENAVHSLEHGAVWITYDPDRVSDDDVATLARLVDGTRYRLMSPYAGLDSPISLQSWNHQLKVDSADDERIKQFADFLTLNEEVDGHYPEIGASCENPQFLALPLTTADGSRGTEATTTDAPSAP